METQEEEEDEKKEEVDGKKMNINFKTPTIPPPWDKPYSDLSSSDESLYIYSVHLIKMRHHTCSIIRVPHMLFSNTALFTLIKKYIYLHLNF